MSDYSGNNIGFTAELKKPGKLDSMRASFMSAGSALSYFLPHRNDGKKIAAIAVLGAAAVFRILPAETGHFFGVLHRSYTSAAEGSPVCGEPLKQCGIVSRIGTAAGTSVARFSGGYKAAMTEKSAPTPE